MFVFNFTNDFFNQILNRHQTINAAIFIDHQSHVGAHNPHLQQQFQDLHGRRDKQHFANNFSRCEISLHTTPRQHIFGMDKSNCVVQCIFKNRQARMTFTGDDLNNII